MHQSAPNGVWTFELFTEVEINFCIWLGLDWLDAVVQL